MADDSRSFCFPAPQPAVAKAILDRVSAAMVKAA